MTEALIDSSWLADRLEEVRVLDVRMDARPFTVPTSSDEARHIPLTELGGQIPGSTSIPWKSLSVTRTVGTTRLHGMRPDAEAFERLLQEKGVKQDDHLIIAGRAANVKELAAATRLYWLLKYFGHDRVSLLDGGVAQWALEGRPLTAEDSPGSEFGDFRVKEERKSLVADLDEVESASQREDPQLLDSRAPDHYLGLTYARRLLPATAKGHIPSAKMFCAQLVANRLGPATIYPAQEIRRAAEVFGAKLDQPSITYCVSGVLSTLTWFAVHELLGNHDVAVFDGSMHEWSQDPSRPVVRLRLD